MTEPRYNDFFSFARERHAVYLKRQAGLPRPWTQDPILQRYKFTNVFRELDRTTAWFREHVRDPMRDRPEVLLATVVFRWLNRIATGEAIFLQGTLTRGHQTAFEQFLVDGDVGHLEQSIRAYCGDGPYVTGAYMIKSPTGMEKLPGMMKAVDDFARRMHPGPFGGATSWRAWAEQLLEFRDKEPFRLEEVWSWIKEADFQGPFHAYEVVTDLRHTALLDRAPDIMTWANPGPGAQRGLARIFQRQHSSPRKPKHKWRPTMPRQQLIEEMQNILSLSQQSEYWPQWSDNLGRYICRARPHGDNMSLMQSVPPQPASWPEWEMREVEHTLCEFDKMERVRLGEGEPRGRFQ